MRQHTTESGISNQNRACGGSGNFERGDCADPVDHQDIRAEVALTIADSSSCCDRLLPSASRCILENALDAKIFVTGGMERALYQKQRPGAAEVLE